MTVPPEHLDEGSGGTADPEIGAATPECWAVTRAGQPGELRLLVAGLQLTEPGHTLMWTWTELARIDYPTPFSIVLRLSTGNQVALGFRDRHQLQEFRQAVKQTGANAFADSAADISNLSSLSPPPDWSNSTKQAVTVVTLGELPGRRVVQVHGMVTAHVVMSRNMFSDFGSGLRSAVGGNLGGIEIGIERAMAQADDKLRAAAAAQGADAVLGARVGLESVADKAEAVLITGTAVSTVALDAPSHAARQV